MKTTARDITLIILLITAGAFLAITIVTTISELGSVVMTKDYRIHTLMSTILGLLLGLNSGIVLNIKTRKGGLFAIGFIAAFVIKYADIFSIEYNEFALGLISGILVSAVSIFRLVEFNIQKVYRYLLVIISILFVYSLLTPLINSRDPLLFQNNSIALGVLLISMGIIGKVVK